MYTTLYEKLWNIREYDSRYARRVPEGVLYFCTFA